ncbi:unnamed protein product [Strongylus vulgaris]|uniref:ShKT domain-containing protein n=1 Tax=Strongylus vulgaris TaxID=40348 RepID=A0A3P7JUB0_STRVU|nr:unnamed protein product [Strongylus vulgaris]
MITAGACMLCYQPVNIHNFPNDIYKGCVDKVNPQTGTSDCPQRRHLCEHAVYRQLMAEQCPLTCNKCTPNNAGSASITSTCRDFADPRTGVSDCPQRAGYCRNAVYAQFMREQCPRTCGYC